MEIWDGNELANVKRELRDDDQWNQIVVRKIFYSPVIMINMGYDDLHRQ